MLGLGFGFGLRVMGFGRVEDGVRGVEKGVSSVEEGWEVGRAAICT